MSEKRARSRAWRGTTDHSGFGRVYDAELVDAEVVAVCDHYLTGRRREGRRYVYACPDCGKPDFEVEPVKGLAGCFNPACPMPKTTGALGIISHLEGLERQGAEFVRCLAKGYEILGLAPPEDSTERRHVTSDGRGPAQDRPGAAAVGQSQGRRWVRQNGEEPPPEESAGAAETPEDHAEAGAEARGKPATPDERVYPVEAYVQGPDGGWIPTDVVVEEEGQDVVELPDAEPREEEPPPPALIGPKEDVFGDERELRHAVYEALLELCPLEERDARFFEGRGLDRRTVEEGRFGSISPKRSRWVVDRLAELFGEELLEVPGFYLLEKGPGRVRFSLYGDYALIPYHDAEGFITTVEGRLIGEPKNPWDKKYKALLGSGVHLYVHPRFEPAEVVAICEGAIGAMVAARYGVPVAAIKGFRNYKVSAHERGEEDSVLPELEEVDFAGRGVVYIPDVDVKTQSREEVMAAVPAACEWLVARQGGVPKVALLPDGAKDLDEWLLSPPESERAARAHDLLAGATDLAQWARSAGDGRSQDGASPTAGASGAPARGKRDLLGDDEEDTPPPADLSGAMPRPDDPQTTTLLWDADRPGGTENPDGGDVPGSSPPAHDAERARKGPMHPSMARWYEVARYTGEQVAGARRRAAMRKVTEKRRPPLRDTPVVLPRWTPGDAVLAGTLAVAVAAVLCLAAYVLRGQTGIAAVVGGLLTWPAWWLEAALYAWAGALAANWTTGRRRRARGRQLAAHLRGEE